MSTVVTPFNFNRAHTIVIVQRDFDGRAEAMESKRSQGVTQPRDMDMDSVLEPAEEREQVRMAGWETLRRMKEEQRQLLQEKIERAVRSYKRQKTVAVEPEVS
jgi:hypothetical protein